MIKKYIKVEEGSYRGQDMSGRGFPILNLMVARKVDSSPLTSQSWMASPRRKRCGSMSRTYPS